MYGSSVLSKTEDQAAWPVLVIWIVFDNRGGSDCLTKFLHTDPADDTLLNGVLRKFKLAISDFATDFLDDIHVRIVYKRTLTRAKALCNQSDSS